MKINIEQFEEVQRYLNNEMTNSEEKSFEKQLVANQNLKDYYVFETELGDILQTQEFKKIYPELDLNKITNKKIDPAIKNQIALIGEKWNRHREEKSLLFKVPLTDNINEKEKIKKSVSFKIWLFIAAAACVISFVLYLFWVTPQNTNRQNNLAVNKKETATEKNDTLSTLAANNSLSNNKTFKPAVNAVDLESIVNKYYKKDNLPDDADLPPPLVASLEDYNNNNYKTIENQNFRKEKIQTNEIELQNSKTNEQESVDSYNGNRLDEANSEQNIKEIGHYYKGLAFIETKNYNTAKQNLQWVIDSATENEDLIVKAKWYLALLHLKENDKPDALRLLKSVADNNTLSVYRQKAQAILKDLR